MWVWIARWLKRPGHEDEVRRAAEHIRAHWMEAALDQGLDPGENVTMAESDRFIRVGISEHMDAEFREGPGEWRYY